MFGFTAKLKLGLALALLALYVVAMVGCSGVSRVPYGIEKDGTVLVQTTVSDAHAFAPTSQRSWLERCEYRTEKVGAIVVANQVRDRYDVHYTNCVPLSDVHYASTTGYIAGVAGPLLYSGAVVGASALLGAGIADSGSTTSVTNSTNTRVRQVAPQPIAPPVAP